MHKFFFPIFLNRMLIDIICVLYFQSILTYNIDVSLIAKFCYYTCFKI